MKHRPPPFSPKPHPPGRGKILPWPADILGPKGPDPGPPPLSPGRPARGPASRGRKEKKGLPRGLPLPLQAFLAGALLVLLARWVSPPAEPGLDLAGGVPPPAFALEAPSSLDPPGLKKWAGRLWEARAWPSLWKKSPLLGRAREARDEARALGLANLAARMEMLLEIYGPPKK